MDSPSPSIVKWTSVSREELLLKLLSIVIASEVGRWRQATIIVALSWLAIWFLLNKRSFEIRFKSKSTREKKLTPSPRVVDKGLLRGGSSMTAKELTYPRVDENYWFYIENHTIVMKQSLHLIPEMAAKNLIPKAGISVCVMWPFTFSGRSPGQEVSRFNESQPQANAILRLTEIRDLYSRCDNNSKSSLSAYKNNRW